MDEIKILKKNNKKKMLFLFLTIILSLGISLASIYFIYIYNDTRDNQLTTGLISLNYTEGSEVVSLDKQVPVSDDVGLKNKAYEFSVQNTSQVPINVRIELIPDESSTLPLSALRYAFYVNDELITIDTLEDTTLYLYENFQPDDTINGKLIFWIDYDYETPGQSFSGTIKVTGESFDVIYTPTAADLIISKYGTDSTLVAVNTDGTLYTGTGEIREYRYSGPTANNYVIFNDDGDNTTEANELWRIVGVYKNSDDNWNLKLMRNTMFTTEEFPETYVYNDNDYIIYDSEFEVVYWNSGKVGTNVNDWTTAGLQYFLNTTQDSNGVAGYYSTFTINAKNLIDENYEYHLGNVSSGDTAISAYNNERDDENIWEGNFPTWNGAISLLYPSDYGYSASSSYWSGTTLYNYNTAAAATSWMQQTTNHSSYDEWFLSPSSNNKGYTMNWKATGWMSRAGVIQDDYIGVRGVLNLKSIATMEDAEGTIDNPYRIIEG